MLGFVWYGMAILELSPDLNPPVPLHKWVFMAFWQKKTRFCPIFTRIDLEAQKELESGRGVKRRGIIHSLREKKNSPG